MKTEITDEYLMKQKKTSSRIR